MGTHKVKVLVIDDEPQIRRVLAIGLGHSGYAVEMAETGAAGLRLCRAVRPDLILLDLGLPDIDGQQVIQTLRAEKNTTPLMVLSVRSDPAQIIMALDNGADNYMVKPFGMDELQARLRSLQRRASHTNSGETEVLKVHDMRIDLARHEVTLKGQPVELSPKEFSILHELASHANKVLTHRHLLLKVWGPAQAEEHQYLRVYMGQLRKKLMVNNHEPTYLRTLQGVGYIFDTTVEPITG